MTDFAVESPDNYEQKCLCVLVLDVSASMSGKAIEELNKALQEFYQDISEDSTKANRLEICLIEFHSLTNVLVEPSLVDNFTMPTLHTKGSTKLVDAVREAVNKVQERKDWYKQTRQKYYRPWIVLMTDGEPDGDQDTLGLSQEIKSGMESKTFNFFAVGVAGANMNILQQISSPGMPPAALEGLKFSEFFQWLSNSMGSIANSSEGEAVDISAGASDWMKGFKI